ncbi:hypothetical protein RGT17_05150 [Bacillus altitudinis]|uniref:hypothetical protein n=1 Tax=Bacillus pumilus TaxID=1408 RepID=UPI0025A29C1A|nr:hypothetical protein [Bacillus pumilus]MDM5321935.1 hypothetical protein [Bacillus pumilus]MDR4994616.1 hypothetical protein [Bacillus altitudinis]
MGSFMLVVMIILASLGTIVAHLFTPKDQRTSAKRSSHHGSTTRPILSLIVITLLMPSAGEEILVIVVVDVTKQKNSHSLMSWLFLLF